MSDSWIIRNMRAIRGRAYPRIVGAQREPSWLFFEVVLPLFTVAAYAYVYQFMEARHELIGYVVLGGAMTAFWLNVLWSMAAQFYWEKEIGNLQLYMIAPISRMSILAGMALGGMLSTTVNAASTLVIGAMIFNIAFNVVDPLMLIAIFVTTMVALYGMGMMFASLYMLFGREAHHMSSLLTEPVYLASGFYFPVRYLGAFAAAGASFIPITLGLDALRQLFFTSGAGDAFLSIELELALLVGLCALFMVLAHYSLRYMEYLGKATGRLTLRWQ
jgi:ABC-2 type transport system permease protein